MKMVFATVRPEKTFEVTRGLEANGYYASTKWNVSGRGKQKGIQVGDFLYEEMSKVLVMVAVEDEEAKEVASLIIKYAKSGSHGNSGDGKIFIMPIETCYTISSGKEEL